MIPNTAIPSTSRVHISLLVRDLDASVSFYTTLFGRVPSKVKTDYANWRLDAPAIHLALNHELGHTATATKQHFGIEIESDELLEQWGTKLEAAGLNPLREDAVTCCYAVANKFWVKDPDGNDWELWVRKDDAESMHGDKPMALHTLSTASASDEDC